MIRSDILDFIKTCVYFKQSRFIRHLEDGFIKSKPCGEYGINLKSGTYIGYTYTELETKELKLQS